MNKEKLAKAERYMAYIKGRLDGNPTTKEMKAWLDKELAAVAATVKALKEQV